MGNDLKTLETLTSKPGQLPREAIKDSWEILSKNVIETAKLFGFRRDEEDGSDLKQAVYFLSLDVLGSQGLMTDMYALKTALEEVEKKPDADVSAKDAEVFVRSCMTVLRRLLQSLEGDR